MIKKFIQIATDIQITDTTILEMTVVQNSYSAEYRSGGSAVVSMTTKSGTNEFHGTVFSFTLPLKPGAAA